MHKFITKLWLTSWTFPRLLDLSKETFPKIDFSRLSSSSRFDMARHFTAAVDVESSEFLYRTTGTQAFFMALFSVTSLLMRFFYHDVPRTIGITIATLSYVSVPEDYESYVSRLQIFSIYSFVVPLVMVRYARRTTDNRKSRILSQVGVKSVGAEGADNYFGMMKSQWET